MFYIYVSHILPKKLKRLNVGQIARKYAWIRIEDIPLIQLKERFERVEGKLSRSIKYITLLLFLIIGIIIPVFFLWASITFQLSVEYNFLLIINYLLIVLVATLWIGIVLLARKWIHLIIERLSEIAESGSTGGLDEL
jgi:hypothetical protein